MPAFEAGRSLTAGEHVVLGGTPVAHHIVDVLRVRSGDRITLFHAGEIYDAVIESASRSELAVRVESVRLSVLSAHRLTLLQAIIRPALLDDVVRTCSPLGVQRFFLFSAERSQPWNVASRLERLNLVAASSAEQAETGQVPTVHIEAGLADILANAGSLGTIIVLSPQAPDTIMSLARSGTLALEGAITVVVGPEGGFSEAEETLLNDSGALRVHLGTGILRSELAGFAALLLVRELQSAL